MPAAQNRVQAGPLDAPTELSEAALAREKRREKRMESRRREIVTVAEELFATHGYSGTSLEKIAAGTGYSVGGIYNFFPSKDAVYAAVRLMHTTALAERLTACASNPGTGLDRLVDMAEAAIRHMREFPDQLEFSVQSTLERRRTRGDGGMTRAILEAYVLAIRAGQADGTVRSGDPLGLAQYVGGLVFGHMNVDPEIAGHGVGIALSDFLEIVRNALGSGQ